MTTMDSDGLTPLDIAKENRNEECIRLLFKAQKLEILVSDEIFPKGSVTRFFFFFLIGLMEGQIMSTCALHFGH